MAKGNKNKFITMRIDTVTYEQLKVMALREHRTMTNLISLILYQAIETEKKKHENI